ncbi:MAG TPA: electron transfer flavoprotein subunit beta/FixA family protein [Candidatus Bathyarchaeia archaeon]|nr:electron transfer flavoprotein subunit beta/FixA family protein [Candidatus Bathyarchaeia archaeon]
MKAIEKTGLVFDINEWDDYGVEEAVRLKEKHGGTVTAITVGSEEADSTLRKCLARGADRGVRLTDPKFEGSDGFTVAKILARSIKNMPFNVVITGTQSSDVGSAVVGPMLAEMLSISHATMVKKLEIDDQIARVRRELEGGLEETVEVKLPAVIAVQTGINEPRYVSIMGIRKAMQKEIKVLGSADLGLSENEIGEAGSWLKIGKFYVPPVAKQAEFLKGSPDEVATRIAEIIKAKGLM